MTPHYCYCTHCAYAGKVNQSDVWKFERSVACPVCALSEDPEPFRILYCGTSVPWNTNPNTLPVYPNVPEKKRQAA
jgi:hypothetical protein